MHERWNSFNSWKVHLKGLYSGPKRRTEEEQKYLIQKEEELEGLDGLLAWNASFRNYWQMHLTCRWPSDLLMEGREARCVKVVGSYGAVASILLWSQLSALQNPHRPMAAASAISLWSKVHSLDIHSTSKELTWLKSSTFLLRGVVGAGTGVTPTIMWTRPKGVSNLPLYGRKYVPEEVTRWKNKRKQMHLPCLRIGNLQYINLGFLGLIPF